MAESTASPPPPPRGGPSYVPARHPMTSSGRPGILSPAPPRTKSYGVPGHLPADPDSSCSRVSSASNWNPTQSGDSNPSVSYGATADSAAAERSRFHQEPPLERDVVLRVQLDVPPLDLEQVSLVRRRGFGPDEVAHVHDHEWPFHARGSTDDPERLRERRRARLRRLPSLVARPGRRAARLRRQRSGARVGSATRSATPVSAERSEDVSTARKPAPDPVRRMPRTAVPTCRRTSSEEPTQTERSGRSGMTTRIPIARILGRTDAHARPSPPHRRGTRRRASAPRQPPPIPPALRHGRGRRRAVLVYRWTGDPLGRPEPTTSIDTQWPIKQVIYVMMENRSFDNLFGRFPGVNGTTVGVKWGEEAPLISCPDWLPGDLPHDRAAALNCLNGGKLDGFAGGEYGDPWSYSQFQEHQLPNYWHWAKEYALSDNFYASALGPSYPNHYFFIAGQVGRRDRQPGEHRGPRRTVSSKFKSWGCDALGDDVFVLVKDGNGNLSKHDSCFNFKTVGRAAHRDRRGLALLLRRSRTGGVLLERVQRDPRRLPHRPVARACGAPCRSPDRRHRSERSYLR